MFSRYILGGGGAAVKLHLSAVSSGILLCFSISIACLVCFQLRVSCRVHQPVVVSEWILLLHPFVQTSVQRRQFLSCRIYNGQSLSSRIFLPKYEHDCGLSCWDLLSYSLHRVHLVCFGSVLPSEFSGFLAMSVELQLPEHIDSDRVQFDQLLPGFFNIRVQMSCRIILLLAFLNSDMFHGLLLPCRLYDMAR